MTVERRLDRVRRAEARLGRCCCWVGSSFGPGLGKEAEPFFCFLSSQCNPSLLFLHSLTTINYFFTLLEFLQNK